MAMVLVGSQYPRYRSRLGGLPNATVCVFERGLCFVVILVIVLHHHVLEFWGRRGRCEGTSCDGNDGGYVLTKEALT